MNNRPDAGNESDARPTKRRRKSAKRGVSLLLITVILLLFCLLSSGGLGIGAFFYFRGKEPIVEPSRGANVEKRVNLSDRFQGSWQGTSPGRPTLRLRLDVRPDNFTFVATNIVTKEDGVFTHNWKAINSSENTMLIRQHRAESDKSYDWKINFKSADEMSIKSVTDGNILGEYTRVAK